MVVNLYVLIFPHFTCISSEIGAFVLRIYLFLYKLSIFTI